MDGFRPEVTIDAKTARRGGKQHKQRRKTGVVSRVPRTSLWRYRPREWTETLSRGLTPSSIKQGQNDVSMDSRRSMRT